MKSMNAKMRNEAHKKLDAIWDFDTTNKSTTIITNPMALVRKAANFSFFIRFVTLISACFLYE
jgi:hypothetical protein